MKHLRRWELRLVALTALTMVALAVGGPAWAWWTDSGTVTTGQVTGATSVPTPLLSCSVDEGQNHQAVWAMPDGYHADKYRFTMTYHVPGDWQTNGGGTPAASIWGEEDGDGTYTYWNKADQGFTTDTWAAWGVQAPLATAEHNYGTVTLTAIIGGWESSPVTLYWEINYTCMATVPITGTCIPPVSVSTTCSAPNNVPNPQWH